ncbi:MAG: zinc ribbon domain-containing protein [Sphaerobacter sp.]|nr:zinc ribbon domain-containing protein [Sphaerobacter sp.]
MEAIIARAIQVVVALGGAYILALWFALAVWTFQDIQQRSRSVIAQIFSTLVVVLFFVPGVLIYLILRPRETLDEAFQRSLEEEYLLQDLEELPLCPSCQRHVAEDFVYCPYCRTELRQPCPGCERLIDLRWEICPYCGVEQYPAEEPAIAEEWERPEPAVGRLVQGARARLTGRWSRLPAEETIPIDQGAVAGPSERGVATHQGAPDAAAPVWRGERGPAPDGNGSGPVAARWGDPDAPPPPETLERTDELPAGSPPPRTT